jgi:hypothetical protein
VLIPKREDKIGETLDVQSYQSTQNWGRTETPCVWSYISLKGERSPGVHPGYRIAECGHLQYIDLRERGGLLTSMWRFAYCKWCDSFLWLIIFIGNGGSRWVNIFILYILYKQERSGTTYQYVSIYLDRKGGG